jgi:ligand-binding sensor domain-containing protein
MGSTTRICADKTGNVWVGYRYATTVSRYSHATNSWTNNFNIAQIGGVTEINSIRVDDSNNVWVCGMAGLAKFDQTNWTFFTSLNTPMQAGNVLDIAFDSLGNKWIATEHGLYKYDNTSWTLYDHTNTPMFGDWVSTLVFDANGILYIHAEDAVFPNVPQGILSFDGTSWVTYTTTNSGLPEQFVNRMALDTFGNIWINTMGNGAAIFNPNGVAGYSCLDKSLSNCSTPTSINENNSANENNMLVYPNPLSSMATLEFNLSDIKNASVSIIDVTGREVKFTDVKNINLGNNKITIDLSSLNNGIYFCQVKSVGKTETMKLVKQ